MRDSRYAALSVVPDGDGYVLGSRYSRDFVAVPAIGGEVVRWLQAGYTVEESAERAALRMGEPVDVAGFVAGLTAAGLLPADDAAPDDAAPDDAAPPPRTVSPGARRAGRILFGPAGLTVQAALAAVAAVVLLAVPAARPRYADAIVTGVPLLSLLIVAAVGTASALVHEQHPAPAPV